MTSHTGHITLWGIPFWQERAGLVPTVHFIDLKMTDPVTLYVSTVILFLRGSGFF